MPNQGDNQPQRLGWQGRFRHLVWGLLVPKLALPGLDSWGQSAAEHAHVMPGGRIVGSCDFHRQHSELQVPECCSATG